MGLIHTEITLRNPRYPELLPMKVNALVDTGAVTLRIPEHVALQLKLDELEKREDDCRRDKKIRSLCGSHSNDFCESW